jgi:hypothetical protein
MYESVEVSELEPLQRREPRNSVPRRTFSIICAVGGRNFTYNECTRVAATARWTRDERSVTAEKAPQVQAAKR